MTALRLEGSSTFSKRISPGADGPGQGRGGQFEYSRPRLFGGITLSRLTAAAAILGAVVGGVVAFGVLRPSGSGSGNGAPPPAVVPVIGPTNGSAATTVTGAGLPSPSATPTSPSPQPSSSVTRTPVGASQSPAASPLPPRAYEGDASGTVLAGGARAGWCGACPDGMKIRFLGEGGTLTFPDVAASVAGDYTMKIVFTEGDTSGGRTAVVSVDGADASVYFVGNGDWNSPQTLTLTIHLAAGRNSVEFSNPANVAPDIAEIVV